MYSASAFHQTYRRMLSTSLLAVMFTLGACLLATSIAQSRVSGQTLVIHGISSSPRVGNGNSQLVAAKSLTPASSSSVLSAAAIQRCAPIHFGRPTALTLDNTPTGLSVQADLPVSYRVFGNTAAQIHSQLEQCGPRSTGTAADFTGQTDYSLSWQYDLASDGEECSLTDVRVGLHTAIALPSWQPASSATKGLDDRWQQFANGLYTHEAGHVSIDKAYAAKLTLDLKSMPEQPCGDAASMVHALAAADVSALNRANDAYDVQTDHGATQGAVLPTY